MKIFLIIKGISVVVPIAPFLPFSFLDQNYPGLKAMIHAPEVMMQIPEVIKQVQEVKIQVFEEIRVAKTR